MTDTVVQNTGNEGANAAQAAENGAPAANATEATAPQTEGETKASATPTDVNTPNNEGDGKVTDADNNKTNDANTQEGSDGNQTEGFDFGKLKLPDGLTVADEEKAAFQKDAEALGIKTQEGAQKFIDWVLSKASQASAVSAKQQKNELDNLDKTWSEEGKKDPVLGKDYDKNVSDAMETAGQIFSPRTMEFLKETRFEKNPDFLKDMLRIHKERADAELIMGKTATQVNKVQRDSQGNPMLQFK